jgi:parallel beta-helix repeat protein
LQPHASVDVARRIVFDTAPRKLNAMLPTILISAVLALALFAIAMRAETTRRSVTVTVGPDGGDFKGSDSIALQKAADEVARRAPGGGGTLLIKGGAYLMYDSLHIRAPMTVRGEGLKTELVKCPQFRTKLTEDFDLSEFTVKVEDASGLRVGMGVAIKDKQRHTGWDVTVRTVVGVDGRSVRLDRRPERDYNVARQEAWLGNAFPLISVRNVDHVVIEDLVANGNLNENRDVPLDGCRGAAIYLHEAKHCAIRRCVARNYNGDGISWQTTQDITVEDCEARDNAGLGLHPGTGSPRTLVKNCRARGNRNVGLFLCWGVREGRFEGNVVEENGTYGISIGHKDTDNLFVNNQIRRNGVGGVYFRDETQGNGGHRCTLRGNVIEDNGKAGQPGFGVKVDGATFDTLLEGNTIRDTRPQPQRTQTVAVHVGEKARNITIRSSNKIEGEVKHSH